VKGEREDHVDQHHQRDFRILHCRLKTLLLLFIRFHRLLILQAAINRCAIVDNADGINKHITLFFTFSIDQIMVMQ
jgi:hypothetical protein